jgi:hypothetical protein
MATRRDAKHPDCSMLPDRFQYLRRVVEKYGGRRVSYLPATGESAEVDALSAGDIAELAGAYDEIVRRGDIREIAEWLAAPGNQSSDPNHVTQSVVDVFAIFEVLAMRGVQPFASGKADLDSVGVEEVFDWSKLSEQLQYLAEPAAKYGKHQFESQMDDFLANASESEIEEIAALAERIRLSGDWVTIQQWLDEYELTDHPEAAAVHALTGIMELGGFLRDQ